MSQEKFKETVWSFYKKEARDLPWRKTKNPYRIWVSEVMLQQTQVARVVPKYKEFLTKFPTIKDLSSASLAEVLISWQGLGYNRRAKLLHEGAKYIQKEHKGAFPKESLETIPGIGPYTAGAIQAFAFNKALPCIETNIRTVYLHHFFKDKKDIADKDIYPILEKTLDKENPREWYWALMDYGTHLKGSGVQINNKSKHYNKQTPFKGSGREVRGAIIRTLASKRNLNTVFPERGEEVTKELAKLVQEGFVKKQGKGYALAS